jgi:hypothetical protein
MTRYVPPPKRTAPASDKADWYQQAARASWMAPIIAILFNCMGRAGLSNQKDAGTALMAVSVINGLIIVLGFLFGAYALTGVKKRGPEGVLAPAIGGLILNALVIALALGGINAARHTSKTVAAEKMKQQSEDVMLKYPGWFGAAKTDDGATIVIAQWSDEAPGTASMKDIFTADCTLISVIVDNTSSQPVTIDPATLQLVLANGGKQQASTQILSTAKEDKEKFLDRYGKPRTVPAGTRMNDGIAFLPPKADLSRVASASVIVNGTRITIPGRYYTADEKAQLLGRSKGKQPFQ